MSAEKTYTLDEAREELARRECTFHGHDWDIVSRADGVPIAIICGRCGLSHEVKAQ